MKTIRRKLVSVFVAATAAIMIFVLILFNIAVAIYFERNTRLELRNTYAAVNVLIDKRLIAPMTGGANNKDAVSEALVELSSALAASRMTGNTEFYIFDGRYELRFPQRAADTMLSEVLKSRIKAYDFDQKGHIERIRTPHGVFYLAGMTVEGPEADRLYVVFVTSISVRYALLGMMNVFLAGIMAVALAIGVFSALASARSLTRPIKNVCRYAREIGNGNFISIPPDGSSIETSELISGINEMSQRLKDTDQAQKLFLQNASHELRTPLMSIQGYSEAIEQGIVSDPKEAAAVIKSESIRLKALVEEIMTLSKMDSNIYGRDFQPIDLGEALADCIDRLNGLALRENKRLVPALLKGVLVNADETLLGEVFINVMSNGLRYAAAAVTVTMERTAKEAVVTVSDDGDGIDKEDLPHLFERFYKGRGGKFGLGLAIARKALELLGGSIEAKNGANGAVFVIRLPAI